MKRNITFVPLMIILLLISSSAFPISVAERSSKDYTFTTSILRKIKPMILNFKTEETNANFNEIMSKFEDATVDHYSRNFDSSAVKFYNLKLSIITLLEKVANQYIARTEDLLKSSMKDNKSIEIFIGMSKNSGYAEYFKKPFNPLKDVKPYNEDFTARDFSYFFSAAKIERYLKNGFFYFEEANKAMNDPVIPYIKRKKKIKSIGADYIINRYMDAISNCRTAKESGLEIYRVHNEHNTGLILDKYDIRKSQITPIFDDRIPEKFKADAVDNKKMLYSIEIERRKKALSKR